MVKLSSIQDCKMKYLFYLLLLLILPSLVRAQGGIFIQNGAHITVKSSPHIVIQDGKYHNDGNFAAGTSTVQINGIALTEHSTIGGNSVTAFHHLEINKANHDVRLDFDIVVLGDIIMNGGMLMLNYSDINLEGDIIGETEANRITGTGGGALIKSIPLLSPNQENPGNLGAEISTTSNLGMTTIRRSHYPLDIDGNPGIFRHYHIAAGQNSALDASLRFHYFDGELGNIPENDLEIWQFDDLNWHFLGSDSRNDLENWVEVSGIPFFHTLTLGSILRSYRLNYCLSKQSLMKKMKLNCTGPPCLNLIMTISL